MDIKESEGKFQSAIIELAEYSGGKVYHVADSRSIRNGSSKGFPDILYAHRTRGIVFAELKNATRKPTAEQKEWLSVLGDAALARPAECYLWRPENWNDIERRLKG